jgi:hypothetical protein
LNVSGADAAPAASAPAWAELQQLQAAHQLNGRSKDRPFLFVRRTVSAYSLLLRREVVTVGTKGSDNNARDELEGA